MMKLDADAQKYMSHVKRELSHYSFPFKKKALHILADDLLTFGVDVPGADYEQICKQFGHPDRFAEGLLDVVEPEELRKSALRRRTQIAIIIVALVIAASAMATGWCFAFNHKITHTVETTVYVEE